MTAFLLVIHVMISIALIGTVLLQRSEGGALGIGGGGGGGGGGMGNLFSSRGAANALTRTTAYLAVGFFTTSILLSILAGSGGGGGSVIDTDSPTGVPSLPLVPIEEPADAPNDVPAIPDAPSVPAIPTPQ